jgi:hypothetical protein
MPKVAKVFNQGEENYFKIDLSDSPNGAVGTMAEICKELNLDNPFAVRYSKQPDDLECRPKTFEGRIGIHKYVENKNYKLHLIISEKFLHLVVKCSKRNRQKLQKIIGEKIRIF